MYSNQYLRVNRQVTITLSERVRATSTLTKDDDCWERSNEMNRLRQRQQQQIQQLVQKHRDQSTELERQISGEAHWIRCENQKPQNSVEAVNRSEWRVEKWSGWRESNPLHAQNSNESKSETVQIPLTSPFSMSLTQFQWIGAWVNRLPLAFNSSHALVACPRMRSAI